MKIVTYLKRWLASLKNNFSSWLFKPKAVSETVVCSLKAKKDLDEIEQKIDCLQRKMQRIIDDNHCYTKRLVS
jgi:hypothetical protein